jgi:hypothetical protein
MDRYYNILGIPSNSSKETIKNAYHTKMKALHPDKVHGTSLEDTATFFASEINDAYNNLMAQFQNNSSSKTTHDQPSFIEDNIYIETNGYLKYTLSNDLNIIVNEIYNRFHCSISDSQSQISWNINHALSPNVKKSMDTHNYNFSMTSFFEGSIEYVVINKRSGRSWYIACYEIIPQPAKQPNSSETYYKSNKSHTRQKNSLGTFLKVILAIVISSVLFQQCNSLQSTRIQSQTTNTRASQVYANVISCDWLNVRRTPSSVNDANVIEAIRVNTRVEILERANSGWVRIGYGNGKTGYVHSNFLSR